MTVENNVETNEVNLAPVELEVLYNSIKRYYSSTDSPDIRDIIVYVRERYPNPWQKVIINSDMKLPVEDLEDALIYIKGVNDGKASNLRGIGAVCYCPVKITDECTEENEYRVAETISKFDSEYNIMNIEVLVYGDDIKQLVKVWEYVKTQGSFPFDIYYPVGLSKELLLFKNGVDLSPYAQRLYSAKEKNEITPKYLRSIVDEIGEQVRAGKTAIQDRDSVRSIYTKWLTICLTDEFALAPVYLRSYLGEYLDLCVAYPFEKLSMFERIQFLNNLPEYVGYLLPNRILQCTFSVHHKIFPLPEVVFNLDTGETLESKLESFTMESLRISDYRRMFGDSQNYFVPEQSAGITVSGSSDQETDLELCSLFARLTKTVSTKKVFLSIKNTLLAMKDGQRYLLYYSEPLGVGGQLVSEFFGSESVIIQEENFSRFIDARVIMAKNMKDRDIAGSGKTMYNALMVNAIPTFKPAIPPFVSMCADLCNPSVKGLSYYDKRLRCDKNILPIVTHDDSKLSRSNNLLDSLDINNLLADPVVTAAISSAGTLNSHYKPISKLPVSIETFRGCMLL